MGEDASAKPPKESVDPRVEGITTVGWVTLAMLGICIPLVGVIGEFSKVAAVSLPLAVILGSGIMAIRIWSSGEKQVNRKETAALEGRIAELEERLANLEMVDSLEAHFAQKHQSSAEKAPAPSESPSMGPSADELSA